MTAAALAATAALAVLAGLSSSIPTRMPTAATLPEPAPVAVLGEEAPAEIASVEAPAVPAPSFGETEADATPFPAPAALRAALNQPAPVRITEYALLPAFPQQETADIAPAMPQTVPLPVARPSEFRTVDPRGAMRRVDRAARRARAAAVAPASTEDDRNFFEKFFGIERQAAPALAYAALETSPSVEITPRRPLTPIPVPQSASPSAGVAVYDISARIVTLPDGQKLEAHSGLGAYMDDPRYVHEKMRGPTPPGTYDLTEREALFHNVRAIRLTPVGGSEAVHNRVGLLAHTFMLGPQGASNGCVSFRDYARFLQAFLSGQVQRLVVVPGSRGSDPTSTLFAAR